ncbi:MAG: hypothetical protein EZS28_005937, partial [Streblomastix strix]
MNGGGIYINSQSSQKQIIKRIQLTDCVGTGNGGGIYCIISSGEIEMNQVSISGCSGYNGGGIYTSIEQSGKFIIKESSYFTNCRSTNGNGGGIYVNIDFTIQSQISVQSTSFDSCQALNPYISNIHRGFGSSIFISGINWDSINNGINLGQVEYINCEADQGDNGLFIVMNELRELCRLGNPRGQYVRSKDYTTNLSNISLLMGYRGSPSQFESATSEDLKDKISELEYYIIDSGNQWHISTLIDGIDRLSCGLKPNPCGTINYALLLTPLLFEGQYNPNTDIAIMILQKDDMIDTVININTATTISNNIEIQSENGGEGKTLSYDKIYLIGSYSESNTLFNVNGEGSKLGLYHLKLDNSFVTSTSPLILLTGNSANNIDAQLHIERCVFAQNGNTPLPELKHNLIQINGGQAQIKDTQISNYLFSNGKSVINIDSITNQQESLLIINRTTFSKIIQQGNDGGSALSATIKSGSSIYIQDYSVFEECISESGSGGAIKIQQNGGILDIKETLMKKCKALNGGGIYAQILAMEQFQINEEVYFEECEAFSTSIQQGRGGAIYINVGQDAPYEFTVGVNLHFNQNKASQYGRDLFILCKNIIVMKPDRRILYDMLNETYDKDNAIFGTESAFESELGRPQMIDFDILSLMLPYYNDIVYISQDQSISENTLKCGRIYLPCVTLSYAEGKVLTPEWTYETVPLDSAGAQQINYTYIIFQGIEVAQPFETEADNVIIRGAFPDEYLFATQRAILIFTKSGQIICSDLAQWQQQGQLERRSVNQNFYIHHLEFVLTEDSEIKSIVKIIGSSSHNDFGRNIVLQIEDCIINQESPLNDISCGFIKSEPVITQLIQISMFDVIVEDIYMIDTSLIDLQYEHDVIQLDNILSIKKCSFTNIESTFSSSSLQLRTEEVENKNYFGASSVISIFGDNALLLPVHISESTFERCKCNLEVSPSEERLIHVGGAMLFIGKNLHINSKYLRFVDCESNIIFVASDLTSSSSNSETIRQQSSQITQNQTSFAQYPPNISHSAQQLQNQQINSINKPKYQIEQSGGVYIGIIDSGSQWVAISQKRIKDKLQEQGLNYKSISRRINDLSRPSIIFDICVMKQCKTTKFGISSTIPTLESGGIILHCEKSLTRCNFNTSIFMNCLISTQSSPSSSTNLAPNDPTLLQNTPFESLWLREKEFGVEGSGLIVAYGRTMPSIKADGIYPPPSQDISHLFSQTNYKFNNNHYSVKLLFGRFSSQSIQLEEQILVLKGQGEQESLLIQKNISQTLFILQNSHLNTSHLSVQLWGTQAALIRSQGNGMSIVNGLRVIGVKQESAVVHCSVFEVISGELKNINKEQRMSSIMMNVGHLKLRDSTFLGEAYTSSGSAIRAYPTGPSTIDVEGVVFKGLGNGQGTNGGAVYVDMKTFDVQMSFKRCIFIGNKADYGSNVFIQYASTSQLIKLNSFIGCASIVENSYEQDISVCYLVGNNDDEIFIDERNLIHSSWNRQKSEVVVGFISNSDVNHTIESKPESVDESTGRVETLIFGEGKISSPFIDLSLARSDIINIAGCGDQLTEIYPQQSSLQAMIYSGFNQIIVIEKICIANSPASPLIGFIRTQGAESGLVMQDMRVQGYLETSPYNTMLEPPYLFSIEGFVHLQDVIFEHIYLRTGAILQVVGLRRTADDSRIEQLGKTSIGFYRCIFDDITSNESVIISMNEKDLAGASAPSEINKISNVNLQNSEKTTKFVIEDTIFSDCSSSLLLGNKNEKGGLLNLKNKKVRFEILNSEYRNIAVKSRNMLYLAWGVYEPDSQQINILTVTETFFTNCSALIPEMDEKVEESQITQSSQPSPQMVNQFINIQLSNELYTNGSIIFDNLYKYGLIFINNLNKEINDSINLATIDITGLFMSNCHSAIGSALTVTRMTLNLQESVFVEPMCYGNMLYLNQTYTTINNCYFNGYNNTLSDVITGELESISDAFCPNNPQYFSSIEYALVYITQGNYISQNDIYKDTRIGAIRIDNAEVELKNVQFSDPWEESSQLDGSLLMIACKGESNLNIVKPTVNQMTEEICKAKSQYSSITNENEDECQFGIVFDDICKYQLSEAFILPPMPVPLLKSAKVVVNVDKDQEAMNSDQMNDYELVRDDKGYLIWPLEDATKLPIYAHGKVRSSNKAKFSMRDYSWLDNRKKWYGIQISNDGKQFYGLDGGNESVRLEVEIEEGEQFVNFIRFQLAEWWAWVVPPIVVGFLTVIVSGIVYIIWNERYKKKKEAEHLKELQLQKEKRKKDEEMSRLNQVQYDEDKDNHTMIVTKEDEVTTQLPK